MEIIFCNHDQSKHYTVSLGLGSNPINRNVWLTNQNGEGMDVADKVLCTVIFDAIDQYFKENH